MKKFNRILTFVLVLSMLVSSFAGAFPVKASAEEASTRVYFYNSDSWAKVNAYVFNASNGEALGGWPGKAASGDGSGWYYVDVPANPAFMIIFHNGSGIQTKDTSIPDAASVYVTVKSKVFTSKEAAEASISSAANKTTVWFYNSDSWAKVKAYVFGASNGEALGTWPGKAAVDQGDGWWSVEVPADPEFTIIFNNGGSKQTANVPINDAGSVYVTVTGKAYASKAAAETAINGAEPAKTTVWFYNSDNWAAVNAYVFGASNGEALGGWPGKAAVDQGDGWWSVEVPADPAFSIIFNNGGSSQTGDLSIADKGNVYVTVKNEIFGSKEAAEASLGGEPAKTTVWFYNSDNWAAVNAYVFGASNGEALGTWPGKAATRDGESDWWSVEVPADPAFSIIFSNGAGSQTGDLSIADKGNVYVTVKNEIFGSKEAAEASLGGEPAKTTVWFYNSDNWAAVNAYVFGASNGEALGGWPGAAATRDGESDWWSVEVPADPAFSIIFNNGDGSQTGDLSIADKENVYVTVKNEIFGSKEAAEASLGGEPAKTTVWFYNSDNWAAVNAYVFGDCGEALGTWPGAAATRDGESNWWSVEVPADPAFSIIFNNGDGSQTGDLSIADKENVYVTVKNEIFGSKEAAEASFGGGEPEPEEPAKTTVWFYNSNGWDTVSAYVFDASNGHSLGAWPGVAATRDGASDWWYVEVPAEPTFYIIFHNNAGLQTGNLFVADKDNVYMTVDNAVFTSKEAAEESIAGAEPAKTTVWFYNSNGWENVNAYVFGASNGEVLGSWPGTAATRDGASDWWYVEVPANPTFSIIFNNGAGLQTGDLFVADKDNVYMTANSTIFASKEAAEESVAGAEPAGTTVWFYNSDNWENVNAYVFGASNGEALGGWPGTAATRDGESDWWYVVVPANPVFSIIFNNGAGAQTKDIGIQDKDNVYVTVTCDAPYADQLTAEEAQKEMDQDRKGSIRIWYYNSEGWARVRAYVFGASNGEVLGSWPGKAATRDGDRWWYIDIDADRPFYIIFNNGSNAQTGDILIEDNDHVYLTIKENGKFTSKEEAEASIDKLKPLVSQYTTVWFYNSLGWENVCAYAWGTYNNDPLGAWPGSQATRYEDTDWWYITCPFPAPFHIIFNDGVMGGAQTQGVRITDNWNIYTTYEANKKYSSKEAAEAAVGGDIKVYFYNSEDWYYVYAYTWGGAEGEKFGAWPGSPATRESADSDWYYVEVLAGADINLIFNNADTEQTSDLSINAKEDLYILLNGQMFTSREEAEAAAESLKNEQEEEYVLWFYNSEDWEQVYAYVEDAEGNPLCGSEPGTLMFRQSTTNWFFASVTAAPGFTVKFSNGSGAETETFTVDEDAGTFFTMDAQFAAQEDVEALFPEVTEPSEEADTTQEAPAEEEKGGAGGVIVGVVAVVLAIGAGAWIVIKKRGKKSAV